MYFYVTFVFSVAAFVAEADVVTPADSSPVTGNSTLCGTVEGCFVTLVRRPFVSRTAPNLNSSALTSFISTGRGLLRDTGAPAGARAAHIRWVPRAHPGALVSPWIQWVSRVRPRANQADLVCFENSCPRCPMWVNEHYTCIYAEI